MKLLLDDPAAQDAQALALGASDGINQNRQAVYYFRSNFTSSGDRSIDNLLYDTKWGDSVMGSAVSLTYSFSTSASVYAYSGEPSSKLAFSTGQIDAARNALDAYAAVANLTFVETTDTASSAGDKIWLDKTIFAKLTLRLPEAAMKAENLNRQV